MKTSDKLYNINRMLSIRIAEEMNMHIEDIETLNLKLGEIIKEIRELEEEKWTKE